jgi:Na+/alanine symporter
LKEFLDQVNGIVWGPISLWLIGLTGWYRVVGLRFLPLRRMAFAVQQTINSVCHSGGKGDLCAFKPLMTALAGWPPRSAPATSLVWPVASVWVVVVVISLLLLSGTVFQCTRRLYDFSSAGFRD